MQLGQAYTVSVEGLTIPITPSSFDLFQLTAAAGVPVIVQSFIYTANASVATPQRVQGIFRSTASTGGTAVTGANDSPAGPAHSASVSYLNTTLGTAVSNSQRMGWEWNMFAPYQWDIKPDWVVIPPGTSLSFYVPLAPTTSLLGAFELRFREVK